MPWKIRRLNRWERVRKMMPLFFFIIMLFAGYELGVRADRVVLPVSRLVIGEGAAEEWQIIGLERKGAAEALGEVLPVATYSAGEYVEDESAGFLVVAFQDITTVNFSDPRTFFDSQVALFNSAQPVNAEPEFVPENEVPDALPFPDEEKEIPSDAKGPLVALYCTHSAESYVPSQGKEKLEGKNGGVYLTAEHLKETLEKKYGISVYLSSTIHDYPDWSKSYANSLATLETICQTYPTVKMFIDLHRDAMTSRESTTADIDGKKTARLMFVVGSDARLPHPNWRENWQYAGSLANAVEELYPGLVKGVRVQDGRYNQHVSPHCLLVEVGGTENSMEEAYRAVELLAEAIKLVVKNDEE